ncbi:L-aspartate oxidase [Rossellomorea aquimaris]|uniref:L-aspartate oxidase n=1 Tax=Rossellomorea aquimaris TaxID=189382 RepID=UPI001CD6868C|nr:L-aspartate oxidase [Rossellomorea aquimaris]MCA1057902.1 L-aspartate oxidase [Rossellomorea aquimaris]
MEKADIIIIGSGIAALQLARRLQDHFYVMIITKDKIKSGNSYLAQGGIAAPLGLKDSVHAHFRDTLEAGRYHQDEDSVKRLIEDGKMIVESLLKDGAPFDRQKDGSLSLGMEGAHSEQRILHSGGDQTGKYLVEFLLKSLSGEKVEFVEGEMVYELVKDDKGRCCGVKTKNKDEAIRSYYAPHIVLATGGIGGLYPSTSNHPAVTGDGMALAFLAGAKLSDMEFIQFHPTLLWVNGRTCGLISEAVRGEGAILLNDEGKRIMEEVDPLLELAPRHVVAECIHKERQMGKSVYLDIRGIKDFQEKFPSISALCLKHQISIEDGMIPVSPGCHFVMGGIVTDDEGRTNIPGLYAIGEVACSGIHGANRLASNSLLEGLVYGERLGNLLIQKGAGCSPHVPVDDIKEGNSLHIPFHSDEIREGMMNRVGIIRHEEGLLAHLKWLKEQPLTFREHIDVNSREEIHTYFMWIVSLLVTQSALLRRESRGGHIRSDFPVEDHDEWFKRKTVLQNNDGRLRVEYHEQNETKIYA